MPDKIFCHFCTAKKNIIKNFNYLEGKYTRTSRVICKRK